MRDVTSVHILELFQEMVEIRHTPFQEGTRDRSGQQCFSRLKSQVVVSQQVTRQARLGRESASLRIPSLENGHR